MQTPAAQNTFATRSFTSRGFLIVLSGPSGAGKNTLLNRVLPDMPDLVYSVSVTTRPARRGEVDGVNYHFVTDEQFDKMIDADDLLEWAAFADYRYGTPRSFVEREIEKGRTIITDIDIQGARRIKVQMPSSVFVFLLPPSMDELQKRLKHRGTESSDAISKRLQIAVDELEAIVDYDYWVLNEDLDDAAERLIAIVQAERARVSRLV